MYTNDVAIGSPVPRPGPGNGASRSAGDIVLSNMNPEMESPGASRFEAVVH